MFPLGDGRIVMSIGDVSGHGVSAATAMAQVRTALRAYMIDGRSSAQCVDRLDVLVQALMPGHTATVVVLVVDPATGQVELANAGHPPPLLLTRDGCTPLAGASRPLLGVAFGQATTESFVLGDGDISLAYTDGVVERRGISIDSSLAGLCEAAQGSDHSDTLDAWADHVPNKWGSGQDGRLGGTLMAAQHQ